jgi:hypothetical protein
MIVVFMVSMFMDTTVVDIIVGFIKVDMTFSDSIKEALEA